jgi:hypothetical protein
MMLNGLTLAKLSQALFIDEMRRYAAFVPE